VTHTTSRPGYVFLLTVLVTGVIAATSALSLMLLAWAAEQNGYLFGQSAQAYEYAQACAERTLRTLRSDLSYAGGETFSFTRGTCTVHALNGTGNNDRSLCIDATVGSTLRRIEVVVSQVRPTTRISSWEEVGSFTRCP